MDPYYLESIELQPLAREIIQIEEEEAEPSIKKLPPEMIAAICVKLEYKDIQQFKNSAKFLTNAYKSQRSLLPGPKCRIIMNYKKNKVQLLIHKEDERNKEVPLEQWYYFFKNAECLIFKINTNRDVPINILNQILCCESIKKFEYHGDSINQNIIDCISCVAQEIEILVKKWDSKITGSPKIVYVKIKNLTNIDDVVEAMKIVPFFRIKITKRNFTRTMQSLTKLRGNTQCKPLWSFYFGYSNEEQIQSIKLDLAEIISHIYGYSVECRHFMHSYYETYHLVVCERREIYREIHTFDRNNPLSACRYPDLCRNICLFLLWLSAVAFLIYDRFFKPRSARILT